MRVAIQPSSVSVLFSAKDTYEWATRPGHAWPCSQLSGNRVVASFDSNGLTDLSINGKDGDCDAVELTAICADALKTRLPIDHPAHYVACGQFYPA